VIVIINGPCGVGKTSLLTFLNALRTKYKHDRAAYSESKGAFVQKVLEEWRLRG
jgi:ABC-type lipoprotein export system ATPase subunit